MENRFAISAACFVERRLDVYREANLQSDTIVYPNVPQRFTPLPLFKLIPAFVEFTFTNLNDKHKNKSIAASQSLPEKPSEGLFLTYPIFRIKEVASASCLAS